MKAFAKTDGDFVHRSTDHLLTASDARMHAFLEAAVDGFVSIDERGVIQSANPAAEKLFGYAQGEMIGRNVSMLMPSPYREEHDGYISKYLATGKKNIIGIGREAIGLRSDGVTFPIELSVAEARVGNTRLFVGFIRDITERKRAEERFRMVVESSPNAIITVSEEGKIALVNSQTERTFGYNREELIGQTVEILVPPRFRVQHPWYRMSFFAAPQARPMGAGRDLFGLRKDGSEFPVEIGLNPIQTSEGSLVLCAIVDITERKRAEEAARRNKEELEKALAELQAKSEEAKVMSQQLWQAAKLASVGELAAGIAHELNNPLATVSLRVESVLKRTSAEDPRRPALDVIAQETKRMADLVANLLQFSRRGRDQVSTVDLRQELTKSVELIHHHLRKLLITVVQDLAPDTPILFADRQKLRQVFLNLLTNAGDAMPQGGTLTLRTRPALMKDGEPAVRIEFEDTGVGIPEDHLEKVFDPFFTTKEEGKGTGLGLAICRRVVEEHHGTMEIVSNVGKGTNVSIVLPGKNAANVAPIRRTATRKRERE